ncbi:MAG: methyl-accepting chemotaxis protein [Nitrospira sp.]|nr:methyl-accepting chemotaxis protein [bacterium]MBL7050065.1 methyl-accepting chemotaxis protein [Nitrospira sp.]
MSSLIETEKKQLISGLSIITASQSPGDAFLGLEGEDPGMADELIKQTHSMGLDNVYFTNLKGEVLHPPKAFLSSEFKSLLSKADKVRGHVDLAVLDSKMLGFATVVDVETPVGFLVFEITVPEELTALATLILRSEAAVGSDHARDRGKTAEHSKASEHLKHVYHLSQSKAKDFLKRITISLSLILVITLGITIVVLSRISSNIATPMNQLLDAFRKMANGDLTQKVSAKSHDEVGELAYTFNETSQKLNNMLHSVALHSENVASAASQLSTSAKNIADNSNEQSDKTTIAASSMDELNSSFLSVAQNTVNAATSAKDATTLATEGGSIVEQTTSRMNKIADTVKDSARKIEALGERSEQIGQIIQVINDIAGQTNLLALNAAIEAARAGEQGRGFAVVADEVRKLAERTTAATYEISEMIKGIQNDTESAVKTMQNGTKEVEVGVDLASKAADSLHQIVTSIQSVTDMIDNIATAAEEQSATGDEVAGNIESVTETTKMTAAAAKLSSEATQSLDNLAQELRHLVSGFKLTMDVQNMPSAKSAGSKTAALQ